MAELDTGVGSSVATRALVHFPTTTAAFPASTQIDTTTLGDTGIGSSPAARADVFDEYARSITAAASGTGFTTAVGGPA